MLWDIYIFFLFSFLLQFLSLGQRVTMRLQAVVVKVMRFPMNGSANPNPTGIPVSLTFKILFLFSPGHFFLVFNTVGFLFVFFL